MPQLINEIKKAVRELKAAALKVPAIPVLEGSDSQHEGGSALLSASMSSSNGRFEQVRDVDMSYGKDTQNGQSSVMSGQGVTSHHNSCTTDYHYPSVESSSESSSESSDSESVLDLTVATDKAEKPRPHGSPNKPVAMGCKPSVESC